jgi:hypothetical protein
MVMKKMKGIKLKVHFIVGNDIERPEYIANNLKKWLRIAPRVHNMEPTGTLPKYRGQTTRGSKDGLIL